MKQHRSIWYLLIRSTFRRTLFLALVLAVVQVGLFWFALERDWTYAEESAEWAVDSGRLTEANPAWYVSDLEEVLYKSGAPVAFGVALTVLVAVLAGSGMQRKSKVSYTFGRLMVSEKAICLWQALYNTLSLLLFWALEVFLMLVLCKWYTLWVGPEAASHQTVFLTCYRSNFLHDLFPLGDILCWVRNLLLCLMMGTVAAIAAYKQRREGKMSGGPIIAVGLAWWTFLESSNDFAYLVLVMGMAACAFGIITLVFQILGEEDEPVE